MPTPYPQEQNPRSSIVAEQDIEEFFITKLRELNYTSRLWQHESYDHIVRNEAAMDAIRRYIRENPKVVRAPSSRLPVREQDAPAAIAQPP